MLRLPGYTADPAATKPLASHVLFESAGLDAARDSVAQVFCPHRLDVIGKGRVRACHHHVMGERLSLNFMEYGAKTLIAPGALQSFYLLQIPLTGAAAICNGTDRYGSTPLAAALLNPHRETTMIWEENTRQLLVQVDRAAMQAHLGQLIGGQASQPLCFEGPMNMAQGTGRSLAQLILHLVGEIDAERSQFGTPGLMSRQIESTIMTGLIESVPNNYSDLLGLRGSTARPRHLRRAEEFIAAHLDQPLTVEDIAAAAGCTPRSLQNAFRKFRDTTPLRFLRDARLARVHQTLLAGNPSASVTDVATRWGFSHLGRFSQVYKERFGESPQTTLRAAQRPQWRD